MSEPDNTEVGELEAVLARTVDELEEQRVAAIELRMLLDASEARLRTMSAELEEALSSARDADERREAARVEAIEMRVILDATEHRVAKLRDDIEALTQERDGLGVKLERLTRELLDVQEERHVLEALLEEASPKLDAGRRAAEELEEARAAAASQAEAATAQKNQVRQQAAAQEAQLRSEIEEQRQAGERLRARIEELEREQTLATQRLASVESANALALSDRAEEVRTLQEEVRTLKEELTRATQESAAVRRSEGDAAAELAAARREAEEAAVQLDALRAESQEAQSLLAESRALADEANEQLAALRREAGDVDEQIAAARSEAEEAVSQLAAARGEIENLSRRVRELEARPAVTAARAAAGSEGLRLAASEPAPASAPEVAGEAGIESLLEALEVDSESSGEAASTRPARPLRVPAAVVNVEGLTVVHLDDRPEYREALEAAVAQFPGVHYLAFDAPPPEPLRGPCLVAVNLLATSFEALALVADSEQWGLSDPRAFTYCADGTRGVILGMVDYFPEPFDADACTARLLEASVQRLLTVSDHIDLMNEIRATMSRFQGSTSVALDARQAFELAALVRPDLVLVDLLLPRGEGLRLVTRLRADAKTAVVPTALLWNRPVVASDLRVQAARLARDTALSPEDLKRALTATLSGRSPREMMKESA